MMNLVKRAMCYVRRKLGKSLLLFFIFFVANSTILGTLSILDTSSMINEEIRKQTNAKVVIESIGEDRNLTEWDALNLVDINNVNSINRMAKCTACPNGFLPVAGTDEEKTQKVCIIGFDDMEKDSPFTENVCRIVEGEFAKGENEIVINQHLAENNQIEIGDKLQFISGNVDITAKVTGIYLTGNERKQTERVLTVNRMENQIYADISLVTKMGIGKLQKIIAYVDNPEILSETADVIREILGDGISISTQDTMYQKMKYSIIQIERITKLVFGLTVITSVFVVGMLLCMWMRNRKVEIAVFVSLGISRAEVFLQMAVEIIFIYSISIILSTGMFVILTPTLSGILSKMNGFTGNLVFSLWSVGEIWIIGGIILLWVTLIAMLPCLTKKIKDTLSEMEG